MSSRNTLTVFMLLLTAGGFIWHGLHNFQKTVCNDPLPYQIVVEDEANGLLYNEFKQAVFTAEDVWENGTNLELFTFDQRAPFTIRLLATAPDSNYDGRTFDQARYTVDTIDVYTPDDLSQLPLIIAHELGHALNLLHADNEAAIMHALLGGQSLEPLQLHPEDMALLEAECGISI